MLTSDLFSSTEIKLNTICQLTHLNSNLFSFYSTEFYQGSKEIYLSSIVVLLSKEDTDKMDSLTQLTKLIRLVVKSGHF